MSIRKYILSYEDNAPLLFNWARYILHVIIKEDTVYPQVTKAIFKLIDSPNAIAIDVGANVGVVTRYFSRHFAKTHSVEPLPYLSSRLKQLENSRIKVHACAVGAQDGEVTIRTPVGADGQPYHALTSASVDNSLSMFAHSKIIDCVVPQYRLSSLVPKTTAKVAYVKIDVEGFEYAVLQGARELINSERPLIQVEIDKTHNPKYEQVLEFMAENKYKGFSFSKSKLLDNIHDCIQAQTLSKNLSLNATLAHQSEFLYIPIEKTSLFKDLISYESSK